LYNKIINSKNAAVCVIVAAFLSIPSHKACAFNSLLRVPSVIKYNSARLAALTNPYLLFEPGRGRGNVTIDGKTVIIGMGGGDTAGLNDFLADMIEQLTESGYRVLGVRNGFTGLKSENLKDNLVELTPEIAGRIRGLPSFVLGSCRKKLEDKDIAIILRNITGAASLVLIGGNDHLKNVEQLAVSAENEQMDTTIIGVPKSIDNDFWTIMHGFWSAVVAGRQIVARASINTKTEKDFTTAAVFECMGRKSGSLTLELSKGCPYPHVAIVPEVPVTIDDVISAYNNGVRNFFVSEGFSLSEEDPKLGQLMGAYPKLKAMWEQSRTNPQRDDHHNPKLTGASLYVKGILKHFCGSKVEKTDLTYQLRGAFLQPDNKGIVFDTLLAGKFAEKTVSLINTKQSGLALTYNLGYGDVTGTVEAKAPGEVYASRNLISILSGKSATKMDELSQEDKELVSKLFSELGVMGVSNTRYDVIFEPMAAREVSLEDAVREAFYGIAVSTHAHQYASVAELPDNMIASCELDQSDIDKLPYALKTVVEGTKDSVLLLVPEKPENLSRIADSIKEIYGKAGYINIAISKDFMLNQKDELLESVLKTDPVLRVKFNEEGIVDAGTGMVKFESGVSYFIVGLYKYLIKQGKIKVEGTKITDLGYAFKGLTRSGALDINRKALGSGV
jgi:6-phosphofructokinase